MSEAQTPLMPPAEGAPAATAGQRLRQLREAAGVSLPSLAVQLKVPAQKLEALESDQYDRFADAVFMRALASSVCRTLKADPAPVLALLPQQDAGPLRVSQGLNTPFRAQFPGSSSAVLPGAPRSRWLAAAVGVLLLGALVIALWPQWLERWTVPQPDQAAPAPAATTAAPAVVPQAAPVVEQNSVAADASAGAVAMPGADVIPAAPVAPASATPTAPAAPILAVPGAVAPEVAPAPASAVLVLRARGPSWVQVRSSSGAVVLEQILRAGDSVPVAGEGPWSVVVGNASATEVVVRGTVLDVQAQARDNVARFEVK